MRGIQTLVLGALLGVSRFALADEPPPPPVLPDAPAVVAPPAADPQPVVDAFERAFTDLFARRFADAAQGFDHVATTTVDPERRAVAIELARRSHALADQAAHATNRSNDGRYGLLIGTSLLGLGLYGPTVVVLEKTSDSKVQVGSYMLAAGASFFLPFLATRDQPVTWGMTDAFWYGSTRGGYHGAMVLVMTHPHDSTSEQVFSSMSLGSILEGAGAAYWASETHASAGLTNAMGKGGDFGALYGTAIASVGLSRNDQNPSVLAAGGLIGSGVGILAGYQLAQRRDLTWGDSEVIRASALIGVGAAAVPVILAETDNHRVILPVLMAGAAAGLVAGDRLVDGHDFSAGQGIVTELSTLAGAGTGAGLGYLVSPDDSKTRGKVIIIGSVLGAAGGFALAYFELDTLGKPRPSTTTADRARGASIQIVPQVGPGQKGLTIAGSF